ncbi:MAG: DUF58 domain-containing protein [Xanthomonadaceae bacterium]|jgi:uncharacterized protein (DUF58 family)|nr:DUF58 domain-containing protein [Xanthomonadaceae bacterium]
MSDGLKPTLAELVALRALTPRKSPLRRGRHGVSGTMMSNQRGRGMEYAESRDYVPGDEVRHIDWRLTARSGRTHTKLFQAEREQLTLLVADTSASLYFGTRIRFKSVQAARAGALAVWMALRAGDRVAALRGSLGEALISPAGGTRGGMRVLNALVRWYSQQPEDDAGLALALEHAVRLLRPGSRLVVLADPSSLSAIPAACWLALTTHGEVTVVLLSDPLEVAPPFAALPFTAEGHRFELALDDASQRLEWERLFVEPIKMAMEELPHYGVRVRELFTDDPTESWLMPAMDGGAARTAVSR